MKRRAIVVVCDGLGVGALPDADRFGDAGTNTLKHVLEDGQPSLPNLTTLGLLHTLYGDAPADLPAPAGAYARMAPLSPGKDTMAGHWELMGLPVDFAFPTYPDGFPAEVVEAFEGAIGRKVLGNRPALGTVLLDELGEEHVRTGRPIVYTSSDSVFQIAAHEEIVPVDTLYRWCEAARELLDGEHRMGRVIARPFAGVPGKFRRTARRRDFCVPPPGTTLLDRLVEAGRTVRAIGKIGDLFLRRGITESVPTESNRDGLERTLQALRENDDDYVFTNLVDFDAKYAHRNDVAGYARALEELDSYVPALTSALRPGDLLVLTSDHGADPSDISTDHTREYVPAVACGSPVPGGADLGTRSTFADVGATVAEHLGVPPVRGESLLPA